MLPVVLLSSEGVVEILPPFAYHNLMTMPEKYKFKVQPFEHQIEGIEYGLNHDKWLLADSMGLGKSKTVIEIANIRQVKHCFIICCKNGLKWNWRNEVHKHSDEECFILGQRKDRIGSNAQRLEDLNRIDELPRFIITNIETLKYRLPTGEKIERKVKGKLKITDRYYYPTTDNLIELCNTGKIDMIAVDEFHRVKDIDSEGARQILKINSSIQIAITGTPIINNPLDVFMSLKWLGYETRSYWDFKSHFCRLGGYNGRDVIDYRNLEEITAVLDNMMLRRLKENTLHLPEKIFVDEYVEMNSKQKAIYNSVRNDLLANIDKIISSPNPLAKLTRLRQATGYTGILSNTIKESAKLDRLEEIIEEASESGQKAVVFSNWVQIINEAAERLKRYNPAVITGETKDSDIPKQEHRFQTDDNCKVILGTIEKMGEGFNLTKGTVVCLIDEPWNEEAKKQAIDRCHRIGSESDYIIIYSLRAKDTIDERVSDIVKLKGLMSNILIDKTDTGDINALINSLLR